MDDEPTSLTKDDIEAFFQKLENGDFDIKMIECINCNKKHLPNYGYHLGECDQCYFDRFPKEEVEKFFKSFFM